MPETQESPECVLFERKGHIAVLTINHPPANTWNLATAKSFEERLNEVEEDKSVRVVIITGAGNRFSAGFDVSDAMNAGEVSALVQELWMKVDRFTKPTIAAINGVALGGGCELAMSCHFRFMAEHEKSLIGLTELNLGIIPGWGGTQRMARIIGKARALELILFSERLTAPQALEAGLVNRVCTPEALLDEAMDYAQRLAERPPIAVSAVLKSMSEGEYNGIEAGLKMESSSAKALQSSKDAVEGITAFLEKRTPKFTGE
jgi:enoyl-CoA hydratase/carnithine racemase